MTDDEWAYFEPFLIRRGGRPPRNHHRVLDAVFWQMRTGAPWRDLPEELGNWNSIFRQFRRWADSGVFDVVLEALAGSGACYAVHREKSSKPLSGSGFSGRVGIWDCKLWGFSGAKACNFVFEDSVESRVVIPSSHGEEPMRPKERRDTGQSDLLRSRLDAIIDMNHALVKLARTIDWSFLEQQFGAVYEDKPGRPPLPTRLMTGLAILKHTYDLS